MRKKINWKPAWKIFIAAIRGFGADKVPKLSASLAYSTVFSMAPLLIVIISFGSLFFGQEAVQGKIYHQLETFLGLDTAIQIQDIIKKAAWSGKSTWAAILGTITLFLAATAIFAEIQSSINGIWGIKPKPRKGVLKWIRNRLLSFSVIISLGFLLLVSLVISSVVDQFSARLQASFPHTSIVLFYIVNQVITLLVVTMIFAVIFKVLPDARIPWKDVILGAIVTALLFMLGKFLISVYISNSRAGTTFGPAAAIIVLLLWTYYSAFILYFGAEFTKAYVMRYGDMIVPNQYSVAIKEITIEKGKKSLQKTQSHK